jgi:spore coat polysaccharide biosynthesis protein SpsF (cytidylyltransferase family)
MLACLIQARSTSTRFPGKCFAEVKDGLNCLDMIYKIASTIIPATYFIVPDDDKDIIDHLQHVKNYPYFTGPFEPLKRYVKVAHALNAEAVVRLTADCPVLDIVQLEYLTRLWIQTHADFISNAHPQDRHTVDGDDVEILSVKMLEWLDVYAQPADREHVTAHAYKNPKYMAKEKLTHIFYAPTVNHYGTMKTSVDTPEDLERIKELCK